MNTRNFTLLTLAVLICLCIASGAFAWYVGVVLLALTGVIAKLAHAGAALANAANGETDVSSPAPRGWEYAETASDDMHVSPYLRLPRRARHEICKD